MPEPVRLPLSCDLLVFDLDGTLVDSEQDLVASITATLAHLQRTPLDRQMVRGFIGDGAAALVSRALEATGGSDGLLLHQALLFFLDYYREHKLDTTQVYPGVLVALQCIRDAAPTLPMAILSNKPVNPSIDICNSLDLSPFFFAVLGGNSLSTKKPDPQGMHSLMQQARDLIGRDVVPAATVLVGDSHVDVETARAAGVLSLGCTYGLAPERLRAAAPDALVDSPSEWLQALWTLLPGI